MSLQAPPGWFPDPYGRYEHRYWDGFRWTEHVGSYGQQMVDGQAGYVAPVLSAGQMVPPATFVQGAPSTTGTRSVQRQVRKLGVADASRIGGGTLFTEPILVVNQKAKLFERRAEYAVFDQYGRTVGSVREFGSGIAQQIVDRDGATKRFQIVDADGRPALVLTRPATMWKSTVVVMREDGTTVGQIVQENLGMLASVFGGKFNVRFRMEAEGKTLGSVNTESWQAWDFSIQDPSGNEIARITKTWAGFTKETFTKADNYVLEIHRPLEDPLLSLVVSASLTVDTVLRQSANSARL